MAYSLPAYSVELDFNDLLTGAGTPSTDPSSPVSSYPSSPASSPITQSDESHIPRPSNAYIIFRSEFVALNKESLSKTQQKASKLAGAAWRELPKESQDYYRDLAKQRKEEHARAHPGYKYKPHRSKRGKKADGRKKTDVPHAQISMDGQRFYHSLQLLSPLCPGFFSLSLTLLYTPSILDHSPPPASLSSIQPEVPWIEEPGAFSIDNMNENEDLRELLMRTYSLDSSYLNMIYDQLGGSLYNEWGSMSDPGYPAADNPMNYSPLLPSLSSMASDEMERVFHNSLRPY
ncbi:hypothetical protein ARMGADRAFT_1167339 [Armillaria gallica]|uniref:HMG box domain-containing protein n=1 Tax=Armillaria gallica TaxID=47427 RepID=A0A2H3DDP0_ARMGA|nr:hypothetical protein ARMGADRAFT_1167339 [Armillaria gallica]